MTLASIESLLGSIWFAMIPVAYVLGTVLPPSKILAMFKRKG